MKVREREREWKRRDIYQDVTVFLLSHIHAGTDATGAFTDVGHSEDAQELRNKYLIGVVGSTPTPTPGTGGGAGTADEECERT